MKKVISWIAIIATTAALAVGGTVAYLTDTDEDINVQTIGNIKIEQHEQERVDPEAKDDSELQEFTENKPLYPAVISPSLDWETENNELWDPAHINNEVDKLVTVENTGDYDAYVRTVLAFEAGTYTFEQFQEKMHLNLNDTDWDWEWIEEPVIIGQSSFFLATATHKEALKPGETTAPSLLQVALDPSATNDDVKIFGTDYLILAGTQAIQTEGFDDPITALETGFYKVSPQEHPFSEEILPYYIYTQEDFINFAARGGRGILMADLDMDSYGIFNRKGTVLDMNGHTIYTLRSGNSTFNIRVDHGGELTITGGGKFGCKLEPEQVTSSVIYFCTSSEGSLLVVEDCYVDCDYRGEEIGVKVFHAQSKSKIIVNGGNYVRTVEHLKDDFALVYTISGAHIEINGGTFQNAGTDYALLNVNKGRPGSILVNGGTFINHHPSVSNSGYIDLGEGCKVISEVKDGDTYYTVVPEE